MAEPADPVELVVSEVFGPTFQGEGASLGRRTGFVRLGRCNLACRWCDTPYTWDWDRFDPQVELTRRPVRDVVAEVERMGVDMVVVTGGEPLLQQRGLSAFVEQARARRWRVEVETAGTLVPSALLAGAVDRFNVSPKLANSGNARGRRYRPDVLRALEATGRATFKFVAADEGDLDEIAEIVEQCDLGDVWVMPEGTEPEVVVARARSLAPAVLARGWNLTTRLHVLLWGDRRGV